MLHAVCCPPQRAVGLSGESLSRAQTRVRTAFATSLAASLAQLTRTVASDSVYAALFLADRPGHVSATLAACDPPRFLSLLLFFGLIFWANTLMCGGCSAMNAG